MFNPFKKNLNLTALTLALSPLISCYPSNQTTHEIILPQESIEQIILQTKPTRKSNSSYEEQLARETERAMLTFQQYQQNYPSISDSGLILIVSDIPYFSQQGQPGIGINAFRQDVLPGTAPQVLGTLFEYNNNNGFEYNKIMSLPMMHSIDYGYRSGSHRTPAGLFTLTPDPHRIARTPYGYWNGNPYVSSAVLEIRNIEPNFYTETSGWHSPNNRELLVHGTTRSREIDGRFTGGCIRAHSSLVIDLHRFISDSDILAYLYIQAPFEKRPQLDQDMILSVKSQNIYLAEL